ncbi:hypothetical protein KKI24_18870 [bacterium]|nr:hypothetical protein [bacterium]
MEVALKEEFEYYLKYQDELVEKYNGKVVVIKKGIVLGAYESSIEAIEKTRGSHELGTFLIQKCSPGPDDYTVTFHSRVRFE